MTDSKAPAQGIKTSTINLGITGTVEITTTGRTVLVPTDGQTDISEQTIAQMRSVIEMKLSSAQETEIRKWTTVFVETLPTLKQVLRARLHLLCFNGKEAKHFAVNIDEELNDPHYVLKNGKEKIMKDKMVVYMSKELQKPLAFAIWSVCAEKIVFELKPWKG